MHESLGDGTNHQDEQVGTIILRENGLFPNNPSLPLVLLKRAFDTDQGNRDLALAIENRFRASGWGNSWRNGLYDFHHYHSTAHEALGIYKGWVTAQFGGPGGPELTALTGDVLILPAGVAHKNIEQSGDFMVVGAYPQGQIWDMCYGRPGERPAVDRVIAELPLPGADPVFGVEGPLLKLWTG